MHSICAVCAIQYYNTAIHCMILYICLSQGWRGTFLPVACKIREAWFKKSQNGGRKWDCFFSLLLQLSFILWKKWTSISGFLAYHNPDISAQMKRSFFFSLWKLKTLGFTPNVWLNDLVKCFSFKNVFISNTVYLDRCLYFRSNLWLSWKTRQFQKNK